MSTLFIVGCRVFTIMTMLEIRYPITLGDLHSYNPDSTSLESFVYTILETLYPYVDLALELHKKVNNTLYLMMYVAWI